MSLPRILLTGLFVALSQPATMAAEDMQAAPTNPLFTDNAILEVTIAAPLSQIISERPIDDDMLGQLRYRDPILGDVALDIGIRTRGRYRQQYRVCPFAPLRLNFKKKATENTLFRATDKIKLVTHCRTGSPQHEQGVLREYLAYRIFNLMTESSFRVRLLRVSYLDTDSDDNSTVNYAILIEPAEQLAERLGMELLEVRRTYVDRLDGAHTNLASVFQYLIGNTDFSPIRGAENEPCCHNYVLVGPESGPILSIPYDLDMSGLVNAPYAKPNPRFRLRSVRSRLYRGRCANNVHLDNTLQAYRDRRQDIYGLVTALPTMDSSTSKRLTRYIDSFYATIDNPQRVESRIRGRCLGRPPASTEASPQ